MLRNCDLYFAVDEVLLSLQSLDVGLEIFLATRGAHHYSCFRIKLRLLVLVSRLCLLDVVVKSDIRKSEWSVNLRKQNQLFGVGLFFVFNFEPIVDLRLCLVFDRWD